MIVLAALCLAVLFVGYAFGSLILRRAPDSIGADDHFFVATWLGLLVLGGSLLWIAEFVPLGPVVMGTVGIAAVCAVIVSDRRGFLPAAVGSVDRRYFLAALAIASLGVSVITSRDVVHGDTAAYQLQEIIWLKEHGLVPGLALLHHRLGYNSIWLALVSPVVGLGESVRFAALGGTVAATLLVTQLIVSTARIVTGRDGEPTSPSAWHPCPAWPAVGCCRRWSRVLPMSPSGILTVLFGWILILDDEHRLGAVAAMFGAGAIAIKLSGAPLLAGGLAYLVWTRPTWASWRQVVLFTALTLGSVAAANLVTAGCAMFPAPRTCVPVPWGVESKTAHAISAYISQWPLGVTDARGGAHVIAAHRDGLTGPMSLADRLHIIRSFVPRFEWAALVATLLVAAVRVIRGPARGRFAFATAVAGLGYCVAAPSYRFVAGWLGIVFALAVCRHAKAARIKRIVAGQLPSSQYRDVLRRGDGRGRRPGGRDG